MSVERFEALTPEEFDKRLEASNERKRLEITELEERLRQWEALIARKEAFLARLQQTLAEIEREDDEIAAMEKELPPLHRKRRHHQPRLSGAAMITASLRRTVRTLYAFACGYCGVAETEVGSLLTIDHYQPEDAGGTDDIDNLVYACHVCNLHKSTAWNPQLPPVLHPLQTDLSIHLRLLPDGTLEGLTAEGTRHIETLHLNRQPMVERRKRNRVYEMALEQAAQLPERQRILEQQIQQHQRRIRLRGHLKRRN